ncbi:hypothetical protein ADUPG1_003151, partial [Aduncisulcus paluster]
MIPSKSTTAEEAKQALLEVIGRHGVPKSVRTDGGSQFTSHLWYELMSELGTTQTPFRCMIPQNRLGEAGPDNHGDPEFSSIRETGTKSNGDLVR